MEWINKEPRVACRSQKDRLQCWKSYEINVVLTLIIHELNDNRMHEIQCWVSRDVSRSRDSVCVSRVSSRSRTLMSRSRREMSRSRRPRHRRDTVKQLNFDELFSDSRCFPPAWNKPGKTRKATCGTDSDSRNFNLYRWQRDIYESCLPFFASVPTNLLIYANEVRSSIIEPCAIIAVLRRACSIVWK